MLCSKKLPEAEAHVTQLEKARVQQRRLSTGKKIENFLKIKKKTDDPKELFWYKYLLIFII